MSITTTAAANTVSVDSTATINEHKVFVGNLSFKTTKDSLASFAESSGKVLETAVITRGSRSLGYGFIKFATKQEAEKAAKDLNHQSLEGRDVNVEVARPKSEEEIKARESSKSKRNMRQKKAKETEVEELAVADEEVKEEKKMNKRKSKKVTAAKEESVKEEDVVPVATDAADASSAPVTATAATSDEEAANNEAKEAARRKKRAQKEKKRQNKKKMLAEKAAARQTEPSKTTLFVANLPYVTKDEDMKAVFKDFDLVSAHVARMKNGRSKGYGFVEFKNEEDQLKALETLKEISLDGRAVYLKIAVSEHKAPKQEGESEVTNSQEKSSEEQIVPVKKEEENPITAAECK